VFLIVLAVAAEFGLGELAFDLPMTGFDVRNRAGSVPGGHISVSLDQTRKPRRHHLFRDRRGIRTQAASASFQASARCF
jgi:hypothetical protein